MRKRALVGAASVVLLPAVMLAARPQQSGGYSGHTDYMSFCASCHGMEAKGDGVIAKSLKKHPPDLTLLSQRNGGTFPADRVIGIVEASEGVEAHMQSDMPAWGEVFAKSQESQSPEAVRQRVTAVVAYLKTIQAK